jgi:hypothetical protein
MASSSRSLSTPRLLSFWTSGPKACRPDRFSKLIIRNSTSPKYLAETSIPNPGRHYCRLVDDDADGAVEARRLLPREPQVKRGRSGGLNRRAWSLPSSASLS